MQNFIDVKAAAEASAGGAKAASNEPGFSPDMERAASILETHLYTCGWSQHGQLGLGMLIEETRTPTLITEWEGWEGYKTPFAPAGGVPADSDKRREVSKTPIIKLISAGKPI